MSDATIPIRPEAPSWPADFFRYGSVVLRALIIVAAGTLVLFPVLNAPWYGDDDLYLTNNPLLREPGRLWKAWFEPGSFVEYYPIEQTVQWIQWQLWGMGSTFGYHLTNLVLHLTSALLLWRLLGKLGLRWAWLGGLLFAVHPLVVDSVGAANELKNTLSLPPFLLAMGYYLDFDRNRGTRSYLSTLLLFLAAMLCKVTMYFFPALILLYAWWQRGRIGWADWKSSLPFFAISIVFSFTTVAAGVVYAHATQYQSPGPIHLGGIFDRIALAGLCLAFYFGHFFLPLHSMPYYPQWSIEPLTPWLFLPWIGMALVVFCCWRMRNGWGRPVLFALAFFVLGLAPFLGFKETSYMCLTWVADHFLYIPMIGLIGLLVAGLEHAGSRLSRKYFALEIACVATLVALLGLQTHKYARLFVVPQNLWSYNLRYNPNSWLVIYELGLAWQQAGKNNEAVEQFQKSIRLNDGFVNTWCSLGYSLCNLGRYSEGIDAFRAALKIHPQSFSVNLYLASALMQVGRNSEALEQFQKTLELYPNTFEARVGAIDALIRLHRLPEAEAELKAALRIHPEDLKLRLKLNRVETMREQETHGSVQNPSSAIRK